MRPIPVRALAVAAGFALAACGGGGGGAPLGPSPGPTPTPMPSGGVTVHGFVYYDEDGNGQPDPGEDIRIPGASVDIGGRTGTTDGSGRFAVANVPEGTRTAAIDATSLPSYYEPGPNRSVTVPATGDVALGATLPIGRNRPNLYLAFGDSITAGDGSSDGEGYLSWLRVDLTNYFGHADLAKDGHEATRSNQGAELLGGTLARVRPAFTLIMYGTNDWNRPECRPGPDPPCFTIDALRSMIGIARSMQSLPVVATIPPVNTGVPDHSPPERQEWVRHMNERIRPMVAEEHAVLAEVFDAMMAAGPVENLFADHVHPDDSGYQIIGQAFFRALSAPRSASPTSYPRRGGAAVVARTLLPSW